MDVGVYPNKFNVKYVQLTTHFITSARLNEKKSVNDGSYIQMTLNCSRVCVKFLGKIARDI